MKKVVAILLAGVLAFGGAVTAFAAPSPSASNVEISSSSVDDIEGVELVKSESYTSEDQVGVDEIKADPAGTLEEVVGEAAAENMSCVSLFDLSLTGDVSKVAGQAITVTLKVDNVLPTSNVIVLHYTDGAWHQEDATPGTGTVTITLSSLSPVAIYVDEATAAGTNSPAGTANNGSTTGNTTTSPKTGEAPIAAVAAMIALCAVVGLAVSSRRRHA